MLRLGGIYALEGVMISPDHYQHYQRPILQALSAFVRYRTIGIKVKAEPEADIQAVLIVMGEHEIPWPLR
jgi:hypothetical protein